ncbi:LPS-assembly protein LptD [termite gut metagenome]|uniref:LPS-assembly protein LptD n=1 Tax=termite gut metagenome TaxID=433724 RepID=A0A5J4SUM9_9ZZZZ
MLRKDIFILVGILCLFGICLVVAQEKSKNEQRKRVDLLHADSGQADKLLRPDVQVLIGAVKFRHDSMYMYCDSALVYEKLNSIEAFDNVRMEQGDTLFIYADYLYYDGISQLAMLRNNVKMTNRNTELTTDSLNYDRLYDMGYYFEGGMLTDEENILTSDWGEYSPATKLAVFNHEVQLENPRFTLTSDTLKYSTQSKVATILGPSNIVSDNNHIYSERGVYNTSNDQAELLDRSVLTNEGKQLTGDSLFYDRHAGYGEAFENVQLNDTINKNMLTGNYCFYNEHTGGAFATDRAVAIDYSQGDSLFMHADTLRMNTYYQETDSMYRIMKAYYKVRIYRTDVQGICDSLVFNSKDSCLTMYNDPVLWNGTHQLLGEEIKMYMNDSTIDWAHVVNQTLMVEQKDSIHYNQVSGKEIKAYFQEKDLRKVDVISNVKLVFYPEDEKDSTMIGMNVSETSLLNMYLRDRKMEKIVMAPRSEGILYPMDQIPPDKLRLPTYVWFDYLRPLNKEDIFHWRGKKSGETLRKTTRKPITSPKRVNK